MKASELVAHIEGGGSIRHRSGEVVGSITALTRQMYNVMVTPDAWEILTPKRFIEEELWIHFGDNDFDLGALYAVLGVKQASQVQMSNLVKCRVIIEEL